MTLSYEFTISVMTLRRSVGKGGQDGPTYVTLCDIYKKKHL